MYARWEREREVPEGQKQTREAKTNSAKKSYGEPIAPPRQEPQPGGHPLRHSSYMVAEDPRSPMGQTARQVIEERIAETRRSGPDLKSDRVRTDGDRRSSTSSTKYRRLSTESFDSSTGMPDIFPSGADPSRRVSTETVSSAGHTRWRASADREPPSSTDISRRVSADQSAASSSLDLQGVRTGAAASHVGVLNDKFAQVKAQAERISQQKGILEVLLRQDERYEEKQDALWRLFIQIDYNWQLCQGFQETLLQHDCQQSQSPVVPQKVCNIRAVRREMDETAEMEKVAGDLNTGQ